MSEVRLIDAVALRERLLVLRSNITNIQYIPDIFDICLTEVSNAPTVNTVSIEKQYFIKGFKEGCEYGKKCYERPQGEWVEVGDNQPYSKDKLYGCSKCRFGSYLLSDTKNMNFCSNCGAAIRT